MRNISWVHIIDLLLELHGLINRLLQICNVLMNVCSLLIRLCMLLLINLILKFNLFFLNVLLEMFALPFSQEFQVFYGIQLRNQLIMFLKLFVVLAFFDASDCWRCFELEVQLVFFY